MSIRILIVDSSPIFRQGLRQVCELGGFEIVGEATNSREAVALACDLQPDIVLMNIGVPTLDGIQATKAITAQNPSTRVIVLTTRSKDESVLSVIQAGAYGCLPKGIEENTLIEAIQSVHRGKAMIDPYLTAQVLDEFRQMNARNK